MGIYDIDARAIDGRNVHLKEFALQALLIVNVASKCGFTPQYAGLEALYEKYHGRGFTILAFPCNQFGSQEPGDEAEIAKFCSVTYNVTFPMFAKVDVNGKDAHPLYLHLKQEAPGVLGTEFIKWNFTKFLVDTQGNVVKRFGPAEAPESLAAEIEPLLPRA